jgi:hypothetical protein
MLASEYLLLQEMFNDQRREIMAPSAVVLAFSIGILSYTYKKYRKASR